MGNFVLFNGTKPNAWATNTVDMYVENDQIFLRRGKNDIIAPMYNPSELSGSPFSPSWGMRGAWNSTDTDFNTISAGAWTNVSFNSMMSVGVGALSAINTTSDYITFEPDRLFLVIWLSQILDNDNLFFRSRFVDTSITDIHYGFGNQGQNGNERTLTGGFDIVDTTTYQDYHLQMFSSVAKQISRPRIYIEEIQREV